MLLCSDSSAQCQCHNVFKGSAAPKNQSPSWSIRDSTRSPKMAVKCSTAQVKASSWSSISCAPLRTIRCRSFAMFFLMRGPHRFWYPCFSRWRLICLWRCLWVDSWPINIFNAILRLSFSWVCGKYPKPAFTASTKNCSPSGKLIDKAFANAVKKASLPFQCIGKPTDKSTCSWRTCKDGMHSWFVIPSFTSPPRKLVSQDRDYSGFVKLAILVYCSHLIRALMSEERALRFASKSRAMHSKTAPNRPRQCWLLGLADETAIAAKVWRRY